MIGIPLLVPYCALALGEALRIDGKAVVSVVDPTLESGYLLIESVDSWLRSNRTKP